MKSLYVLLATPLGRRFWCWMIQKMPFALPVDRLRETPTLLAFRHPKPAYAFHVILVPRQDVASLANLDPQQTQLLTDLFSTVQSLVNEYDLQAIGYRLVVNGGPFQEFPHLHFHLISDKTSNA